MTADNHPIEKEQVMAYLDGELPSSDAVNIGAHLEQCAECREVAVDLRTLSSRLQAWSIEPSQGTLNEVVHAAIPMPDNHLPDNRLNKHKNNLAMFFTKSWRGAVSNRWVWAAAVGVACLVVGITIGIPRSEYRRVEKAVPAPSDITDYAMKLQEDTKALNNPVAEPITAPMIARTAALTISVRNFETARSSMDQIVRTRNGYVGELKITSPKDAPQSLETTLRIPAGQFDAALADFRALGRVEQEQQGGEEVTAQVVDLDARLKNARATEAHLAEVLRTRTGKIGDILEVEKEMARVREEIEQMEAQQKEFSKRVAYASIDLNLAEEYQAQLSGDPSSTTRRMRNSMVEGYHTAASGLLSVLLLLFSAGPTVILWSLILFWPARWAWRRWD